MWEAAFQEYVVSGQGMGDALIAAGGAGGENVDPATGGFQQSSYYDPGSNPPPFDTPTTEQQFVTEVTQLVSQTGGTITSADLDLISSDEWMDFLNALFGFVTTTLGGADQNSYYNDHSNEAPLGEYFIEQWGFLPSIQHMPGYHYYDYLTQDIDPEFLEIAYGIHTSISAYSNAGGNLSNIENMPFTLVVAGSPISVTWHSGTAPADNLHANPSDSNQIIVTASTGYFTVDCQPAPSMPNVFDFGVPISAMMDQTIPISQALHYLEQSPEALLLLRQARDSHQITIHLQATSQSYAIGNDIYWNPHMGLMIDGYLQSPALGLIHEILHALSFVGPPMSEAQLIGLETQVATELGEPTRNSHSGGTDVPDVDVTAHTTPPH